MTCEFAFDDGAYVLGALAPAERQAFERHLAGCADCTRSVGELAGLPGLLGQVDPSVVDDREVDDPVPATLLRDLTREVRQVRRRRTWTSAGLAAAAAVAIIAALTVRPVGGDETALPAEPGTSSPSRPSPSEAPQQMQQVGEVPVRADVTVEQVTWGTRLALVCTYDVRLVSYDLPPEVDYTLYVRTRDGRAERLGSWRSVDKMPMRLTAGTALTVEELESVEVRTADGRVVLRLAT